MHRIYMKFATKKNNFFWTDINPCVREAEYAVRGIVPTLANQMQDQIRKGSKQYPFNQITYCNIGNPQQFQQKPITYFREVLSCVLNPDLIENQTINIDARRRAKKILDQIVSAGSYTNSIGIPMARSNVAKYISRKDEVPEPPSENIILTDGASQGVHLLLNTMILDDKDAILIPIPQYPLYTASISLNGGVPAPYYLNEDKGWQLDIQQLERALSQAKAQGKRVKCIVVINPGNPTGSILNADTIKEIIQFAVTNRLVILADQVYRENIYKENATFVSFRRVLETLSQEYRDNCELASLHSVSKGLLGQCGLRGGYTYLHNFNPVVYQQLVKLKSINLCSSSIGQLMVDLMVNPLQDVSEATKIKFETEYAALFNSLKYRAKLVSKFLNEMTNIKCNEVEGAMYAFPSIKFSKKAIEAATAQGKPVDLLYCLEVLKNTGIALVPGSGFRQYPNTYHFRITTLILPQSKLEAKLHSFKKFNQTFHNQYAD